MIGVSHKHPDSLTGVSLYPGAMTGASLKHPDALTGANLYPGALIGVLSPSATVMM